MHISTIKEEGQKLKRALKKSFKKKDVLVKQENNVDHTIGINNDQNIGNNHLLHKTTR